MYQEILYEVADSVATITLNRPEVLNAWTFRMGAEVKHALARAEQDTDVVAILLTGAGRGFCSGADLRQLQEITEGRSVEATAPELQASPGDPAMQDFRGTHTYMMSVRKPVIAAINGPVAGMAVPIALACDLRFASDRASFSTSFTRRGLVAEWGASWLLSRLAGPAHALDLLLSGRSFDAAEAERLGVVNRVLPHAELIPFARGYAGDLAQHCSPTSMAIIKRQVYEHLIEPLGPAEKQAFALMLESFRRPDSREGVAAYLEKRSPRFEPLQKEVAAARPEHS